MSSLNHLSNKELEEYWYQVSKSERERIFGKTLSVLFFPHLLKPIDIIKNLTIPLSLIAALIVFLLLWAGCAQA